MPQTRLQISSRQLCFACTRIAALHAFELHLSYALHAITTHITPIKLESNLKTYWQGKDRLQCYLQAIEHNSDLDLLIRPLLVLSQLVYEYGACEGEVEDCHCHDHVNGDLGGPVSPALGQGPPCLAQLYHLLNALHMEPCNPTSSVWSTVAIVQLELWLSATLSSDKRCLHARGNIRVSRGTHKPAS